MTWTCASAFLKIRVVRPPYAVAILRLYDLLSLPKLTGAETVAVVSDSPGPASAGRRPRTPARPLVSVSVARGVGWSEVPHSLIVRSS